MKKKSRLLSGLSIIAGAILFITACNDSAPPYSLTIPEQGLEEAADHTIRTPNYIISVHNGPQGDLFSIHKSDQSLVASKVTEEEFKAYFPEAFDEFALHGVSDDGFDGRIYYDEQNSRVIRMPE